MTFQASLTQKISGVIDEDEKLVEKLRKREGKFPQIDR